MLIGVDASRYNYPEKTGVEYYSHQIINGLMEMADDQHLVKLYSPTTLKIPKDIVYTQTEITQRILVCPKLWTLVCLSLEMLRHKPDVLFVSSHVLPLILAKKSVITIHDLAFEYFKNAYAKPQYFYLKWFTKRAVKKADRIIVPSEATKKDLLKFYDCPEKKVRVIPHGADEVEMKPVDKDLLEKFWVKPGEKFMLFVGRLEAKKNLVRLVKAFHQFSQKNPDWKLILGGNRGVGFKQLLNEIKALGLMKKVIMPGYLDEAEKNVLFQTAQIFAFPSLYEGFGFPVLEAFQYGVPVLTSKNSSLPEVAGDAAYLVDPLDVDEIAKGLEMLAQNEAMREELIKKGKERVEKFKWHEAAEKTWEVLIEELTEEKSDDKVKA